jgi:uncharacterized protein (TIGR02328 family)
LRGLGWYKKHSTVSYVFQHNYFDLYEYHKKVMQEMLKRKYKIHNPNWFNAEYRGKRIQYVKYSDLPNIDIAAYSSYIEHNDEYLKECINNIYVKMEKEPWKYEKEDFHRFKILLLLKRSAKSKWTIKN